MILKLRLLSNGTQKVPNWGQIYEFEVNQVYDVKSTFFEPPTAEMIREHRRSKMSTLREHELRKPLSDPPVGKSYTISKPHLFQKNEGSGEFYGFTGYRGRWLNGDFGPYLTRLHSKDGPDQYKTLICLFEKAN